MWRGEEAWAGGQGDHLLVLAVQAVHGASGNKVVYQVLHHPDVAPHGGVVEGPQLVAVRHVHLGPRGQQLPHHLHALYINVRDLEETHHVRPVPRPPRQRCGRP